MSPTVKGRLGDRLIEHGSLSAEQLEVALYEQKRAHRPLGEILVSLGFVGHEDIARLIAEDLGLEFVRARDLRPDPLVVSAVDPEFVRETLAFPIELVEGSLRVVMCDPDDPHRVAAVRARFPYPLAICVSTETEVLELLRLHLRSTASRVAELFAKLDVDETAAAAMVPVEALTEAIFLDGIHRGATDIHIEPEERVTRVRYRIDGILQPGENLPVSLTPAVVSRIKILAHLDISERRRPQDGRMRVRAEERVVDVRVSVMPCADGENVVLRLLESSAGVLRLQTLGVCPATQVLLHKITERPHGIFLVTGPTGSGKTTTLYAMLGEVDAMHRNVATVEDPIEYRLPLLRQSQIDPAIGFTFHAGLRALLRQDPDVILIGEIRDKETADMAIKASMTGHLVFSTLHTNSAIGAVPRLVDIGIEPFLIEDSLIAAMGQRLVRRVCGSCAEWDAASAAELAWLGVETARVRRGRGCERCVHTGYQGRTILQELFMPDDAVAEAMRSGASAVELERLAILGGFRPMVEDGKRIVLAGATTMDEVLRVNCSPRLSDEERAAA